MSIFRCIVISVSMLLSGCREIDPHALNVKSVFLTRMNQEDIERIKSVLNTYQGNAVVIDVKNEHGQIVQGLEIPYDVPRIPRTTDIKNIVAELKRNEIYPIARVVCFYDKAQTNWCIKNPDGTVWKDKEKLQWLKIENPEVQEYIKEICVSAVKAGFKEVQLDYVRFSTSLPVAEDRIAIINKFVKYIADAVHKEGAKLSVCVFGCTIDKSCDIDKNIPLTAKSSKIIGQSYVDIARMADAICPMIYPSHFPKGTPSGMETPDLYPYETISEALRLSNVMLKNHGIKNCVVRPYLQAFTATWLKEHREYKEEEIKEQIKAAQRREIFQWGLFSMRGKYSTSAL